MIDLISRLKVTPIRQNTPVAPKKVAKVELKMPAATSAKTLPPPGIDGKPAQKSDTREYEEALLRAGMAIKAAESNAVTEKKFNETMLDNIRTEYEAFVKQLMASGELDPMFFVPPTEPVAETNEPAPVEVEPAVAPLGDFVNGISVGEEAGDTVVVATKKRTTRKKKVEEVVEEAPAETTAEA